MAHGCGYHILLWCLFPLLTSKTYGYGFGDIRLIGGSYQWEGRVEVYMSGTWGTVTDSQWSSDDAQVVCRKLGYFKPGATPRSNAYFGEGGGPIHFDYIHCYGTEYNLTDCETANNTREASHSEDVGVQCQPAVGSYQDGDLRLVGGTHNWNGRVEIYMSRTWGTVDGDQWNTSNAEVVCRQLGHSTLGAQALCCAHYGQGSGPVHIKSVNCLGTESRIINCAYVTNTSEDLHYKDVSVHCQQAFAYAEEGKIRLVNGSYSWEGRVEIYLSGIWGSINKDFYEMYKPAQVVCRQLGLETYRAKTRCCAYFGQSAGPTHFGSLYCLGTESRVTDCDYYNDTSGDFYRSDWGVQCPPDGPENGDIRLKYYSQSSIDYRRGRVEIYLSESWGAVVANTWTTANAEVVCRQLGYLRATNIKRSGFYGTGSGPIHMDSVNCTGSEPAIIDCPHDTNTTGESHSRNVAMDCNYDYCNTGRIRLLGGQTGGEGRIEVCRNRKWGTVCGKQWSAAHTQVVCQSLGYGSEGSHFTSAPYGRGSGPIFMDYVNCSGSESRLWDCSHFTHSNGCTHDDDVSIHCEPAQCDDEEIRLVNGETDREGQVEICFKNKWGIVITGYKRDNFQVICRQLGFSPRDASGSYFSYYYVQSVHIVYLECSGSEYRLTDCSYITYTRGYYSASRGVTCKPASCVDGEVRLVEGETEWEGRLEVCLGHRWGTVSRDGWTEADVEVVCRDLGYGPFSDTTYMVPRSGLNSQPVHLEHVDCSGSELSLLDCSYTSDTSQNNHSKDVGVRCVQASCQDGDVRLVGGDTPDEGQVEVCIDQRWGTVNGDGWSAADTRVVCRQLGYYNTDVSFYFIGKLNSKVSAPIYMDHVGCYGLEARLVDCSYGTDTSEDDHSEDIGVQCRIDQRNESKFSATVMQLEMSGTSSCTFFFKNVQTISVLSRVIELLTTQAMSHCSCAFTKSQIQNSRLLCCVDKPNSLVFQSKIVASLNMSIEQIQNVIQDWVSDNPVIIEHGWISALNVSTEWKINLPESALSAPSVKCGTDLITQAPSSATQSTESVPDDTSSSAQGGEGLTSSVTMSLLVIAVVSVTSLTFIVGCFVFKYFCNKGLKHSTNLGTRQSDSDHLRAGVGPDETSVRNSTLFSNPLADTVSSPSSRDESVYEAMSMRYYKPLVDMPTQSHDLYATVCSKNSGASKDVEMQEGVMTTEQ